MSNSLAKNSIFNVCYQLLNVIFPLISASYVARVLMPSGVGLLCVEQNWVAHFVIFASLGIPNYAIREVAHARDSKAGTKRVFTELISINAISTTLAAIAYCAMIFVVPNFKENLVLYIVCGGSILLNYINVDWIYQGLEDYSFIAVRSFIVKLVSLAALFVFVRSQNDYVWYALIGVCAIGLNNIFNVGHLHKLNIGLGFSNIELKKHIKPIILIFSTIISIKLYTLLDVTILGLMSNNAAVAYYTNADKIIRIIITVITAVGGVLLPRISRYKVEKRYEECASIVSRVFEILFFCFLPIGIGLICTSRQLVLILFGDAYSAGILTMQIMSLLIYALGFSNLFGTQVLLAFDQEKKLLYCTIGGALINITLNLALIPLLSQNGTAVASVASETFVTATTAWFASKTLSFGIRKNVIWKTVVSTLIMTIIVEVFNFVIKNVFFSFITCVLMGGVSFLLSSVMLKNPILNYIVNVLRRRK